MTDCGSDATCACGGSGCACFPNACLAPLPTPHAPISVSVTDYGAVCDGKSVNDGQMTAGSSTLTSATANFTNADVGKPILVVAAGPVVVQLHTYRMPLYTQIASVNSSTTATLAAAATNDVSGAEVVWGTDDSHAIQGAIDAAANGGGTVSIPAGRCIAENLDMPCGLASECLCSGGACPPWPPLDYNNIWVKGAGRDATIVQSIDPGNVSTLAIGDFVQGTHLIANVKISDIEFREVLNAVPARPSGTTHNIFAAQTQNLEVFGCRFTNSSNECLVSGGDGDYIHDNIAANCGKGSPRYSEISGNTLTGWASGIETVNSLGTLTTMSILNNVLDNCNYPLSLGGGREAHCPTDNSACGPTNKCEIPCPMSGHCADNTPCTAGTTCPDGPDCGFCVKPIVTFCPESGSCPGQPCSPGDPCPDGTTCPGSGVCPDFPMCTGHGPEAHFSSFRDPLVHGTSILRGNTITRVGNTAINFGGRLSSQMGVEFAESGRESWIAENNTISYDHLHCEGFDHLQCQTNADCDVIPGGRPCNMNVAVGFGGPYAADSGPFKPTVAISNLTITGPSDAADVFATSTKGNKTIELVDGTQRSKVVLTTITVNFPWWIEEAPGPDNPNEYKLPANTPFSDPTPTPTP